MKKPANPNQTTEIIVLLHGILRSKTDMLGLEIYFKNRGYDIINIMYPSRKMDIDGITNFVHEHIHAHKSYTDDKPLNFVAHSMGGLITRYYIMRFSPKNLHKVVMLGTPNTGSEVADYLDGHDIFSKPFNKLFGPAAKQLKTDYDHKENEITYPLGIIAGCKSINPLAFLALNGEHDGIVPVERTKIDGMTDHIVMPSSHSLMMFNPKIMDQIDYFLKNEKFKRD